MKTRSTSIRRYRIEGRDSLPWADAVRDECDFMRWVEGWDPRGLTRAMLCEIIRDARDGCWRGYVVVTDDHPWYKLDAYDSELREASDLVPGGISFCRDGRIGWDANHYGDCGPGGYHPPESGGFGAHFERYVTESEAVRSTRLLAHAALVALGEVTP